MGVPQQRIVVLGLAFLSVAGFLITWRLTRRDYTSSSTRPVPSPESPVPGLEGSWEGALEVQNTSLRLVLKVSRAAEGGYSATLDSVDQGAKDLPVNAITLSNRLTRVELSSLLASYSALFDSVDQGAKDIPATSVSFTNSDVQLEWPALQVLYHGQLEGGKLVGFWQQGPAELPLDLVRTNRRAGPGAAGGRR